MKLTTEQKIIELDILDGRGETYYLMEYGPVRRSCFHPQTLAKLDCHGRQRDESFFKPYTISYDSIIPLIQKQDKETLAKIELIFESNLSSIHQGGSFNIYVPAIRMLKSTPEQLCDALLLAKGFEL